MTGPFISSVNTIKTRATCLVPRHHWFQSRAEALAGTTEASFHVMLTCLESCCGSSRVHLLDVPQQEDGAVGAW